MENWRSLTKGSDPAGYISKREDVDVRYKGKFANGLYKNKSVFLKLKFKMQTIKCRKIIQRAQLKTVLSVGACMTTS